MALKNKHALGQNWLNNRAILNEIAELAVRNLDGDESAGEIAENRGGEVAGAKDIVSGTDARLCVEIGPGLGYLTSSLLKRFEKVIAVEFDTRLAENLPGSFPGKNLEVVNADILQYDFETIKEPYVVVGNIPYYITSPIIRKVLSVANRPRRVVLLMQKEVAERILDKRETMLSLFVKNYAEVMAGPVVSKEEFVPVPKVDSQVIVMVPREAVVSDEVLELARKGFVAPRKKLVSNLAQVYGREKVELAFSECGIDNNVRPGDLGLRDWAKLFEALRKNA